MGQRSVPWLLAAIVALLALHLILRLPIAARTPPDGSIHDVIRARQIELVSSQGVVVGQLHASEDGSGNLRLRNGKGEVRVKLGALTDGSGLVLLDQQTEPALQLHAQPDGPQITLQERGRTRRVDSKQGVGRQMIL